jgi:hypothetical protein
MTINGFSNINLGTVFKGLDQPEITYSRPPDKLISSFQKPSYEMEEFLSLDELEKFPNFDQGLEELDIETFLNLDYNLGHFPNFDQDLEQLDRHPSDSVQSETITNSLKRNRPETEVDGIPSKRKRYEFLAEKIEVSGLKLKKTPIPPPYISNPLVNHFYKFQSFYDSKDITENQRRYLVNLIIENITASYYHPLAKTENSNGLSRTILLSLDPDTRLLENDKNGLLKLEPLRTWKTRDKKNNGDPKILEILGTNIPYRGKSGNIFIITRILHRILAHEQFSGFKEENKALIGRLTYKTADKDLLVKKNKFVFLRDLYTLQNALASYPFSDSPNVLTNIIDL